VLAALTLAAALAAPRPATAGAGVTAGPGRWFKDAGGRTLILRGVNIAADAKLPNFQPVTDLAALDALPARGVSVARLLFTWEAYEPAPGAYDGAYMAYIKSIMARLHALGILTIVDMHQDAFARSLGKGCGDGFPGWAVPAAAAAARSLQPTPPPPPTPPPTRAPRGARPGCWPPCWTCRRGWRGKGFTRTRAGRGLRLWRCGRG
jgi:hypothetical protein